MKKLLSILLLFSCGSNIEARVSRSLFQLFASIERMSINIENHELPEVLYPKAFVNWANKLGKGCVFDLSDGDISYFEVLPGEMVKIYPEALALVVSAEEGKKPAKTYLVDPKQTFLIQHPRNAQGPLYVSLEPAS